jgi:hypothetical protein
MLGLFRAPKRGVPMVELEVAALAGFPNCAPAPPEGKRQVLLVDRVGETWDALELGPGMIRENITTEGLSVTNAFPTGHGRGESLRVAADNALYALRPDRRTAKKSGAGSGGSLASSKGGIIRLGGGMESSPIDF